MHAVREKLKDVTFHTLQHTYASWLAQSNVSTRILQELGGWKSEKMAKRYSHFTDGGLRQYQECLVDMSQSMTQSPKSRLKLVK